MGSYDVSARGVDYPGVIRVIQAGVLTSTDQYVHQVGPTDIISLPFKYRLVKWQLHSIPIKATTAEQLETKVLALAQAHDDCPQGYFARYALDVRPSTMHAPFADNISPALSNLPEKMLPR